MSRAFRVFPFLVPSGVLLVGILWVASVGPQAAPPVGAPTGSSPATVRGKDPLAESLKGLLRGSSSELGALEAWQKRIFEDEAVPQYQRFIKDYRRASSGQVTGEVDLDSLRKYLAFYAPKTLGAGESRVLVLLRPEDGCEKCTAALPEVRRMARLRLERRGLKPVWIDASELGSAQSLNGKVLEQKMLEFVKARKAQGTLVIQWQQIPVDEDDTAHADEKRFEIRSLLSVDAVATHQGRLELMENDAFETAAARLLVDGCVELGASTLHAEAIGAPVATPAGTDGAAPMARAETDIGEDDLLVEVHGVRDFSDYARAKRELQTKLTGAALVEDRRISRGRAGFAIVTRRTADQIRQALLGWRIDAGQGRTLEVQVP